MKILLLLTACLLSSCVNHKNSTSVNPSCCSQNQTSEQGRKVAKKDLQSGFKIFRYDLPSLRAGGLPAHYAVFQHFGIKNAGLFLFGSLDFMKAYNAVMDKALLKRYGSEYLKYRKKILPPKRAKRSEF